MRTPPSTNTPTLLCESCGYSLRGLESGAMNCSECGVPVADSGPSRRPGSRWQRAPGPASWLLTHFDTLTCPRVQFRRLRIDPRGAETLLATTLLIAALFASPAASKLLIPRGLVKLPVTEYLLAACAVALVLRGLTWIEYRGIRFMAARRGWRLTTDAATQVCAHASIGWVIGPAALTWLLSERRFDRWSAALPDSWKFELFGVNPLGAESARFTGLGLSLLAGMIVFEVLVYAGVRRCRWANPPGSEVATRHIL